MRQAFPCMMWGSCEEAAVGYFMSIAIPASLQAGEVVYTHSCREHADWFEQRHPGQKLIVPRSDVEVEQPA